MKCPLCGGPARRPDQPCSNCVKLREQDPEQYDRMVGETLRVRHGVMPSLFEEYRSQIITAMLVLMVVATALLYYAGAFGFGSLPPAPKRVLGAASDADPCRGTEHCLVAFFAPWCPSCQVTIPFVQALQRRAARNGKVGVQVIVGRDDQENLLSMASKIGGAVWIDADDAFARGAGVRGVPAWWLIDAQRNVTRRGSGLYTSSDPNSPEMDAFIRDLGLSGRF